MTHNYIEEAFVCLCFFIIFFFVFLAKYHLRRFCSLSRALLGSNITSLTLAVCMSHLIVLVVKTRPVISSISCTIYMATRHTLTNIHGAEVVKTLIVMLDIQSVGEQ